MSSADREKALVAARALDFVQSGMKLGLGTGSTADHFVRGLGLRVRDGLKVVATATSRRTEALARELGIPLADLDTLGRLDLTVDGADEIDGRLRLIKGAGGALLREKIVAAASESMVVIADASKVVKQLGKLFPLPVEIVPFGHGVTAKRIEAGIGAFIDGPGSVRFRGNGTDGLFVTDGGNHILDIACGAIREPEALARFLVDQPGVVDHGLFIGLASVAVIGQGDRAELLEAKV